MGSASNHMEFIHAFLPKLLSMLLSWIQSGNLRERMYTQQQRIDILEVAIEDIERINNASPNPNTLIQGIVRNVSNSKLP